MCVGCGRTPDEIERWIALSETERKAIMAQLPARLTKLNSGRDSTKDGTVPARA
jgi:uncharacterized protein